MVPQVYFSKPKKRLDISHYCKHIRLVSAAFKRFFNAAPIPDIEYMLSNALKFTE